METKLFINEFLTLGMNAYFNKTGKDEAPFEYHIVECLSDIYGHDPLRAAFESGKEADFTNLIFRYRLSSNVYDNFLRDTIKYEKFKRELKEAPGIKTNIMSSVEANIISMFIYKCLVEESRIEDISHFENDLLNDFSIIKMHFNNSLNPNKTRETWEKKKKILSNNIELVEIKPKYLDEFTYARYGVNIKDVKKMDYRMVGELNSYIEAKLEELPKEETPLKKKWNWNTAISSGSGFVDALLIMSLIASELSIGLIYLFLHLK